MTGSGVSLWYRAINEEEKHEEICSRRALRGRSGRAGDGRSGVDQIASNAPSKAAPASAAAITCGKTRTIGIAAPITGPAADIGNQQVRWAKYFVKRWNAQKANRNKQIKVVQGDTQLGVDTAFAVRVAQVVRVELEGARASSGPPAARRSSPRRRPTRAAGSASSRAPRVARRSPTARPTATGAGTSTARCRTTAAQGPTVANWMTKKLKWKRVYIIDDQEAYSQGLADGVQTDPAGRGVNVTRDSISQNDSDFSSVIAKIPSNTQGVYIPWQLAPQAQAFGQQLRAAGKGKIKLFGSDGLFDPGVWKIAGSYDSSFPYNPAVRSSRLTSRPTRATASTSVSRRTSRPRSSCGAVTRACADGKATRAEVRRQIAKTKLKTSMLGFPVSFTAERRHANSGQFGIYQIQSDGSFKRIG